jgi:peptidyl-prolyl cis-trans isomerase B (cyclophilin B)
MLGCGSGGDAPPANIEGAPQQKSQSAVGEVSPDPPKEQPARNTNHPVVKLVTTMGDIVVRLDAEKAPITVKQFLWYARNGFYEGTVFHQVIDGYIVLGGGYTEDLQEKTTHLRLSIFNEAYNGLKNEKYTIAMARIPDETHSSTTQFFFNLANNDQLNHISDASPAEFGYCVFGKVLSGADVLDRISKVPVADREQLATVPVEPIIITSVTEVY